MLSVGLFSCVALHAHDARCVVWERGFEPLSYEEHDALIERAAWRKKHDGFYHEKPLEYYIEAEMAQARADKRYICGW